MPLGFIVSLFEPLVSFWPAQNPNCFCLAPIGPVDKAAVAMLSWETACQLLSSQ